MPFQYSRRFDVLDIATHCEILASTAPLRSVVADSALGQESLCESLRRGAMRNPRKGLDITADPVEITLHVQALNGGVRIDSRAQTDVPGLFAAGECAGPHSADRLGET